MRREETMAVWIAAMMPPLFLGEKGDAKKPWNVGDSADSVRARYCNDHRSKGQPGIPAKATDHLFTRRVGSPGYGEGSSQGQKGAALAV
jgi:hypothetical protein